MTCRLELEIRCLTGDKIVMYWYKTGFSSFKQVPFFLPGLPQLPSSSGLWPSALCPGAWPCHLPCKSGQLHFPPADVITCFHQHFLCAHQSKWGCASKSYEEVWCRWAVGAPIFNQILLYTLFAVLASTAFICLGKESLYSAPWTLDLETAFVSQIAPND